MRNPNWDAKTDYRPAYLDAIDFDGGNDADRRRRARSLDGKSMVSGDYAPAAPVVKQALPAAQGPAARSRRGGNRYIALNTTIPPFDNVNLRKAVDRGLDRNALRLARGGAVVGDVATHFLPRASPGFEEAGGMKGPGVDFLANPSGDLALAQEYMKTAGYPSGKYAGAGHDPHGRRQRRRRRKDGARSLQSAAAEARLQGRTSAQVPHDADVLEVLQRPEGEGRVCPNVGWFRTSPTRRRMLDPTFNGANDRPGEQLQLAAAQRPGDQRARSTRRRRSPTPAARDQGVGEHRQA